MAQLALARFRGDTGFAWVSRTASTFYGGIVGLVIWFEFALKECYLLRSLTRYIASGSGGGNPYGLAATLAVAFPLIIFVRLYYPGSPLTIIIFCVTAILVSSMPVLLNKTHQDSDSGLFVAR